ncbi:hypothetical protein ACQEVK_34085 [Streptomyces sp. CA-251251]
MPPSFVYRITTYDPADGDQHGSCTGADLGYQDGGPWPRHGHRSPKPHDVNRQSRPHTGAATLKKVDDQRADLAGHRRASRLKDDVTRHVRRTF